jgi:hypothetical protein
VRLSALLSWLFGASLISLLAVVCVIGVIGAIGAIVAVSLDSSVDWLICVVCAAQLKLCVNSVALRHRDQTGQVVFNRLEKAYLGIGGVSLQKVITSCHYPIKRTLVLKLRVTDSQTTSKSC